MVYLPHIGQQPSVGRTAVLQFCLVHRLLFRTRAQKFVTSSWSMAPMHAPREQSCSREYTHIILCMYVAQYQPNEQLVKQIHMYIRTLATFSIINFMYVTWYFMASCTYVTMHGHLYSYHSRHLNHYWLLFKNKMSTAIIVFSQLHT